jgi:hypothetical protein
MVRCCPALSATEVTVVRRRAIESRATIVQGAEPQVIVIRTAPWRTASLLMCGGCAPNAASTGFGTPVGVAVVLVGVVLVGVVLGGVVVVVVVPVAVAALATEIAIVCDATLWNELLADTVTV